MVLSARESAQAAMEERDRQRKTDSPSRTITKEEEDVIEAAKQFAAGADDVPGKEPGARKALLDAVKALNAPKPVKPEEVEPGTRFRFVEQPRGYHPDETFIIQALIGLNAAETRCWTDGLGVRGFASGARIIPLPDEEQP